MKSINKSHKIGTSNKKFGIKRFFFVPNLLSLAPNKEA